MDDNNSESGKKTTVEGVQNSSWSNISETKLGDGSTVGLSTLKIHSEVSVLCCVKAQLNFF